MDQKATNRKLMMYMNSDIEIGLQWKLSQLPMNTMEGMYIFFPYECLNFFAQCIGTACRMQLIDWADPFQGLSHQILWGGAFFWPAWIGLDEEGNFSVTSSIFGWHYIVFPKYFGYSWNLRDGFKNVGSSYLRFPISFSEICWQGVNSSRRWIYNSSILLETGLQMRRIVFPFVSGSPRSIDQYQTFEIYKSILEIPGISKNFGIKRFINLK